MLGQTEIAKTDYALRMPTCTTRVRCKNVKNAPMRARCCQERREGSERQRMVLHCPLPGQQQRPQRHLRRGEASVLTTLRYSMKGGFRLPLCHGRWQAAVPAPSARASSLRSREMPRGEASCLIHCASSSSRAPLTLRTLQTGSVFRERHYKDRRAEGQRALTRRRSPLSIIVAFWRLCGLGLASAK